MQIKSRVFSWCHQLPRGQKKSQRLQKSSSPAALRPMIDLAKRADMPATAGEMVVVTAAFAMASEYPTSASWEPGLKPYQPNHKIMTPSTNRDVLCPGMSTTCRTCRYQQLSLRQLGFVRIGTSLGKTVNKAEESSSGPCL